MAKNDLAERRKTTNALAAYNIADKALVKAITEIDKRLGDDDVLFKDLIAATNLLSKFTLTEDVLREDLGIKKQGGKTTNNFLLAAISAADGEEAPNLKTMTADERTEWFARNFMNKGARASEEPKRIETEVS